MSANDEREDYTQGSAINRPGDEQRQALNRLAAAGGILKPITSGGFVRLESVTAAGSRELYRGAASCIARVIYGAPGEDGVRRGRIRIEEVPDRSVVRVEMIRDAVLTEIMLDRDGFRAMKAAFDEYGTKVPEPTDITADERAEQILEELDDVANMKKLSPALREVLGRALTEAKRAQAGQPQGIATNGRRYFDNEPAEEPSAATMAGAINDAGGEF